MKSSVSQREGFLHHETGLDISHNWFAKKYASSATHNISLASREMRMCTKTPFQFRGSTTHQKRSLSQRVGILLRKILSSSIANHDYIEHINGVSSAHMHAYKLPTCSWQESSRPLALPWSLQQSGWGYGPQ